MTWSRLAGRRAFLVGQISGWEGAGLGSRYGRRAGGDEPRGRGQLWQPRAVMSQTSSTLPLRRPMKRSQRDTMASC